MTIAPLLDTQAWIWWVDQDRRLGPKTRAALERLPSDDRPWLCDISLWEVATLVARGRLHFPIPLSEWLRLAAHPRTVRILSLTPEIAAEVAELPETFRRHPANRIIVATARVMQVPLLTHDRKILDSRLARRWSPGKV